MTDNSKPGGLIKVPFGTYFRIPIKTHFIEPYEDLIKVIKKYYEVIFPEDVIVISSKILSISQNRLVYKSDMKISLLAKFLSKFASKSSAGIGVNNVYKMQYAIDICGAWKVFYASIAAGIGKLFGKKGIFYSITGPEVQGLDGFYGKSFQEYEDFGIELPIMCNDFCDIVKSIFGVDCVISDTNDFESHILGTSSGIKFTKDMLNLLLKDNPSGQSDQKTPIVIIRKKFEGIALWDLLWSMNNELQYGYMYTNIDTDNGSFPEYARRGFIASSTYWKEFGFNKKDFNLMTRKVDFIAHMPQAIDPCDKTSKYPLCYSPTDGGFTDAITGERLSSTFKIVLRPDIEE